MVDAMELNRELMAEMGSRAKARREELGLSIMQVAIKMGRTYQCIYGMERYGIESLLILQEWANALSVPASSLLFGTESRIRELLESAAKAIDARYGPRKDLVRRIRKELAK